MASDTEDRNLISRREAVLRVSAVSSTEKANSRSSPINAQPPMSIITC